MRRELGDFSLRISEVLAALEKVEGRSQLEIIRDLQAVSSDLIRIRAPSRDMADGTIPLEAAVLFIEHARDLVLAAACAAIDKREYFATRKPSQATEYLERVRMGQTERGSFVLTLLSPVAPQFKPSEAPSLFPLDPAEPYERSVTRTLATSLAAVRVAATAAATQGDMKPFSDAVEKGVSANLCQAIVGLANASPSDGLEIGVSWSPSRGVPSDLPGRVSLAPDAMPWIEEAARAFRERYVVEDFELEGAVIRLARDGDSSERITVAGQVESRARKVTIDLSASDYQTAIRAHADVAIVRCTGELVKEGRSFRLQNPRHFKVVGDNSA
jgi:hypothetical protein